MKEMVEIEVVIDDRCVDPKVTIRTKENSVQVENIINAIEKVSDSDYPQIAADLDNTVVFVSQRDIIRLYVEDRKVMIQTADSKYIVKRPLAAVEYDLNPDRFIRISQSEIINLYKVKCFDFSRTGTIGVEFDCGIKTWASRSRMKQIRELLCNGFKRNG